MQCVVVLYPGIQMLTHDGIMCHAVLVGWVSPSVGIADAMAVELCPLMCIYIVCLALSS